MNLVKTIIDLIANTSALAQTMGDALRVRGFKPGGTVGQVPVKTGSGDFAWSWQDVAGGGASAWNDLTGTADVVPFTTSNGGPQNLGELAWDSAEETLSLQLKGGTILQIGEETLYHVENATGSTITDGTPCAYAGTVGASGKIRVKPWNGSTDQPLAFMGIVTGNIADGQTGYVTHFGKVRGINTIAFSPGAILYANPSGTGLTATQPTSGDYVIAAVVISSHATNGTLLVRPTKAIATRSGIDSRSSFPPSSHKSTHATGGGDALTPADIGAIPTSEASVSATNDSIVRRGSSGSVSATVLFATGENPLFYAYNSSTGAEFIINPVISGISISWRDATGFDFLPGTVFSYPFDDFENGLTLTVNPGTTSDISYQFPSGTGSHYLVATSRTDHKLSPHELAPLAIVTEAGDFNLTQANHANRWTRLTKSSGTTTITLPTTGVSDGAFFPLRRAGAGAVAFDNPALVNGAAFLADVPVNGTFGLVFIASSATYDFI